MKEKTFIVRIMSKQKWDNGFIDMDLSWDVPWSELTNVSNYLTRFKLRPKRKKKESKP